MRIRPEPLIVALAAAGAVAFLAAGLRKAGGLPAPKASQTTEGSWNISDTVAAVLCLPDEHMGDVVYAKHRYPDRVGGELTTVMHYGHSILSVPSVTDSQWITAPPSEVTL
jgi:hypothetical protein